MTDAREVCSLVVVMEYGDLSWYVCPHTEYILARQDPVV